jgi:hypothetical protein
LLQEKGVEYWKDMKLEEVMPAEISHLQVEKGRLGLAPGFI